jgi:toxin ParE1/3/4
VPNRFRKRPQADLDLDSIWTFIAADNVRAADSLVERIGEVFEMLLHNPLAGRARPDGKICAAFLSRVTSSSTSHTLTGSKFFAW